GSELLGTLESAGPFKEKFEEFGREAAAIRERFAAAEAVAAKVQEAETPPVSGAAQRDEFARVAANGPPRKGYEVRVGEIIESTNNLSPFASGLKQVPQVYTQPEEISTVLGMLQNAKDENITVAGAIDIQEGDGPMMAWYDREATTVHVAPLASIIPEGE